MSALLTELPPAEGDVNHTPRRARWKERLGQATQDLLAADERYFLRQSLSTPCLNALDQARGSWLQDLDGRRYLDFHGNSVHQLGHAHPRIVQALETQLHSLAFCPRRYANQAAVDLARELTQRASFNCGGDLGKALFTPSGTTAVGLALKLARHATGRFKTLSFWDSFHGASLDCISVGGEALFRSGAGPLLPGAVHVPPPEPYRCRLRPDGDCSRCGLACVGFMEYVMEHEGDIGAVLAEPLRCTAVHLPPPGFWSEVRRLCDKHGALLIFDETAVCLGRTGRLFANEHWGAAPDLLVLGKGLGGGLLPMAALLARSDLDCAPDRALGHYTHEKSPLGSAVALEVLRVLDEEQLVERSALLGAQVLTRLQGLGTQARLKQHLGDVRGLGLALAVELVTDPRSREPDCDLAEAVLYGCLERGLSFKTSHGNILTLTPPLNIAETDLSQAVSILERTLYACTA